MTALANAVLVVDPSNKKAFIVNKADKGYFESLLNNGAFVVYTGGARSGAYRANPTQKMLTLYIDAWDAVHRHGISPAEVHKALSVIPEYRETLTQGFPKLPPT